MYRDIAPLYNELFPHNQTLVHDIHQRLGTTSRCLDIGCGPGAYVDALCRLGHEALGLDPEAAMVDFAKQYHQGTFMQGSFAQLANLEHASFDVALCIGNVFSYVPYAEGTEALRSLRTAIRPGGECLLQVVNWTRQLAKRPRFMPKCTKEGLVFERAYHIRSDTDVSFATSLKHGEIVLDSWEDTLFPRHAEALVEDFQRAGWSEIQLFGDFKQSAYAPLDSDAIVLWAKA